MGEKAQAHRRTEEYLSWALDGLVNHEHLLAARTDVDPNDDFECPLCRFFAGVRDDLSNGGHPAEVVAFAATHAELALLSAEERRDLIEVAAPWLRSIMDAPIVPWRSSPAVSAELVGATMWQAVLASRDKSNTAAEALRRVWAGWTVHRMVTGARRNTTCVVSRAGHVGLIRMQSWDYWAYTVRDVPPVAWEKKVFEERLAILVDSVHTALITTDVASLIKGAGGATVTTKGIGYAENVRAMCVREVKAAFPDARVPTT